MLFLIAGFHNKKIHINEGRGMIRVGDIYKDERGGRYLVVYDITHQIIWYWAASKQGICDNCCMDAYIKMLTKVEV